MSREMYFSRGCNTFGISYSEVSFANRNSKEDANNSPIYVASSSLAVSVEILINEHRLKDEGTLNLLQRQVENAPIWKSLMFSPIEISEVLYKESIDCDLKLLLRCDIFYPILPDLAHADNVRFLQHLAIKFEYWSLHRTVYFEDLFDTLQYLLTSLMMNLEFKFPLVFSYYGKQLVKINYKNLKRNATLLATPLDNAYAPDHNAILGAVLRKLQGAILYEFNTLNVMKECESRKWQALLCRKTSSTVEGPRCRKSIKLKGIDLRPLREFPLSSARK